MRPPHCPACGALGRGLGSAPQMVGHGVRVRSLRGVRGPDEPPREWKVFCRRFRCNACRAVVAAVPRGVIPGRRYFAAAIALALALYGVEGLSQPHVRAKVSPARHHGFDAADRWRTLSRWIDQIRQRRLLPRLLPAPPSSRRAAAALYARALAALSLVPTSIIRVAAMDGAMMATAT